MKDFNAAWLVAGAYATWGVFIGVDSFAIANACLIVGVLISFYKLAVETHLRTKQRRLGLFIMCSTAIAALLFLGILFGRQREHVKDEQHRVDAEKDQKIEELNDRLEKLQGLPQQIVDLKQAEKTQSDKASQKADDLSKQNEELKVSIEKKDQALLDIANRELSLKFEPKVIVESRTSKDSLFVTNYGQTGIQLLDLKLDGFPMVDSGTGKLGMPGTSIPPQTWNEARIASDTQAKIVASAYGGKLAKVNGNILFRTNDGKTYRLAFTWIFNLKDGEVTSASCEDYITTETK
jgi:hypothetical protein